MRPPPCGARSPAGDEEHISQPQHVTAKVKIMARRPARAGPRRQRREARRAPSRAADVYPQGLLRWAPPLPKMSPPPSSRSLRLPRCSRSSPRRRDPASRPLRRGGLHQLRRRRASAWLLSPFTFPGGGRFFSTTLCSIEKASRELSAKILQLQPFFYVFKKAQFARLFHAAKNVAEGATSLENREAAGVEGRESRTEKGDGGANA